MELVTGVLYRFELYTYSAGVDQCGDPIPGHRVKVVCEEYKVIKNTPKGAWIKYCNEAGKKFVLLTARKQFASKTKAEAKVCFVARKNRYASILRSRLRDVDEALKLIEHLVL